MYQFLTYGVRHPWERSYIQEVCTLEELVGVHNEMYYYLQEQPYDDDLRSRIRVTATRIQEWLEQNGAMMLTRVAGGAANINIQLSAPAPAPEPVPQ
jgi:hypothetical protein